jgi:hypothetical protein
MSMRQALLFSHEEILAGLSETEIENQDALPVSDKLLPELESRWCFSETENPNIFFAAPEELLHFLREFYSRYELSQPQRRLWKRFENFLATRSPGDMVGVVRADVFSRRSRRFAKK